MPDPLTLRQRALLTFIQRYIRENDLAPTYTEMMAGTNTSSKGIIHFLLSKLESKGWIVRPVAAAERGIALVSAWEDIGDEHRDGELWLLWVPEWKGQVVGYFGRKTLNWWAPIRRHGRTFIPPPSRAQPLPAPPHD